MPHITTGSILRSIVATAAVVAILVAAYTIGLDLLRRSTPDDQNSRVISEGKLNLWWDGVPASIQKSSVDTGTHNNINRSSYTGPDSCKQCHRENYEGWSNHSHRWMNALADQSTVKGNFEGAEIAYLGGHAVFYRTDPGGLSQDGTREPDRDLPAGHSAAPDSVNEGSEGRDFRMRLVRGDKRRIYQITQTIGSRFFQYYVGKQVEGPEAETHKFYHEEHVLPFGYWLEEREWVPVVRIAEESGLPDGSRPDPFDPPNKGPLYANYALACNRCHTTFPLGDELLRKMTQIGQYAPVDLHLDVPEYLSASHPELWGSSTPSAELTESDIKSFSDAIEVWEAPKHAITLGISCEACHLGCKEHVQGKLKRPRFLPNSPKLFVHTEDHDVDFGRNTNNINFACGRCHSGGRPQFAAGMSTWNSTESSDAMRGSCYSELTCVDCHNPHKSIGRKWTSTPANDDAICLKCHQSYDSPEAIASHTHHLAGSEGSRCLNCHMPRLNEGMQDVVRTHMIFSPTHKDMIESNHPNACNLCHTERPIDWTLKHLRDWYGVTYESARISESYRQRKRPVALGWLEHHNEAVRLVGFDALIRTESKWALPELLNALDDRHLINRQFAQRGLQNMFGLKLLTQGYRFYMTPEERRVPLSRLRDVLIPAISAEVSP